MTHTRTLVVACLFLGHWASSGSALAQPNQADLLQKVSAMAEKYNYCESNKHNLGSSRSSTVSLAGQQKVTDCRRFCSQGSSLSEYLEPDKTASSYTLESAERVVSSCNEAYLAAKSVVQHWKLLKIVFVNQIARLR